ncbi:hypothetical protein HERIO_1768 [Hepatospora eriocheir]|uniref:Uncharacterized protein n=1 Tax=Hepatospora eriocheir TaxID=1081669 RepID=A0A1X0Q9A7_9MICR|nr:hypothetical protein HERIO_1768 [Hepatospora eriocheir]
MKSEFIYKHFKLSKSTSRVGHDILNSSSYPTLNINIITNDRIITNCYFATYYVTNNTVSTKKTTETVKFNGKILGIKLDEQPFFHNENFEQPKS